jgi:hypothetical protein
MTMEWSRSLEMDLPAFRAYAKAVYAAADAFLDSITVADLAREYDLSSDGLGRQSMRWCLNALVISHVNNMAGEASVLKGLQGAKGYPF